ncbi:protein VACUOLELESS GAMETOPHYTES [Magnolia sinica]|uniref:protein VACUOLELESS GAMETOPHYTES n=1 Tax=Magnolia sinica TaxID=86752 RepID=UPI00265807C2|nr:protein VACUOLELESS GAMETOPHYTES [Magnolia sinica]
MKYNEITHFSHPQHKLRLEYIEVPFRCDGCKEAGIGSRYKCDHCDFDLHRHCALTTPSITHPFYTKCSFQFMARTPGDTPRFCNACEKDVGGFVYHCKLCGFDLHPCCANLPAMLDDGEVKLYLYRKVCSSCHKCGRKGRSWSYRSKCKKYNLHVSCVKEMLVESWQELYFGKGISVNNGSRKLETRIPSLKGTLANHHRSKGKVRKCCEVAGLAVQFIISAVLGDPTAIIAGVIGSFISR